MLNTQQIYLAKLTQPQTTPLAQIYPNLASALARHSSRQVIELSFISHYIVMDIATDSGATNMCGEEIPFLHSVWSENRSNIISYTCNVFWSAVYEFGQVFF